MLDWPKGLQNQGNRRARLPAAFDRKELVAGVKLHALVHDAEDLPRLLPGLPLQRVELVRA
jgi:hypothetical protein